MLAKPSVDPVALVPLAVVACAWFKLDPTVAVLAIVFACLARAGR